MKLSFHALFLALFTVPSPSFGFPLTWHRTGSSLSTFTPRTLPSCYPKSRIAFSRRETMLMYESSSDPPSKSNDSSGADMWTALANTERWITETLASDGTSTGAGQSPYVRKELSYVCVTGDNIDVIVGGIFGKLKELRELGENHGKAQEELSLAQGSSYTPKTFRQTLVVIIPCSEELTESFPTFEKLVQAINHARRNARDYLTDLSEDDETKDWMTSLSLAHLHPKYGIPTPEEVLAEEKKYEEEGEIDLNMKEYKEKRLQARRSPHPTLVIEVRSTPVMEREALPQPEKRDVAEEGEVTREDVKKLEALFGKSVAFEDEKDKVEENTGEYNDDAFYDAIGKVGGIQQISFETPMNKAQNWVFERETNIDEELSSFTVCDTKHVDSAYEFVFSNIAMQNSMTNYSNEGKSCYLVLPNFLTSSATSFEKFSREVQNIVSTIPKLSEMLSVSFFHPEHVEKENRSPVPIFVLYWKGK